MSQSGLQRRSWIVIAASAIALIVSVNTLVLTPLGVLMDPIAQDMGWERATVSNGLSIFAFSAALVMPFAGRLLDAYGIRKVGIPSVLLTMAMMVAIAFVPDNQGIWFAMFAVLGVVSVGQGGLTYMKVASEWIDKNRGLAVGIVGTGLATGQAVAPVISQSLITVLGDWRMVFIALAILLGIVALPPLVLVVREPSPEEREALGTTRSIGSTRELPGLTLGEAARTRQFWILLLTTLVLGCAVPGALVHMVPMLTDQGITPALAVTAMSLAGLAAMTGRLVGGLIIDRFHAPYVAAVVFFMPVVGFVLLSGVIGTTGLVLLGAILIGMAMGGESDLVSYMTSRYMGMKRFGLIYGIYYALLALGYAAGPFVFAIVQARTGTYTLAFVIFGVGLVVCAGLGLLMGRYKYPAGIAIPVADDPQDASERIAEEVLVDNPVLGTPRHRNTGSPTGAQRSTERSDDERNARESSPDLV